MPEYSKTRIQFRRGTAAEWGAAAPVVLASGEPGFVTDTNTLKIGDGSTVFSSLSAITGGGGGGSEVNDLTSVVTWANVPDANITESSVIQHSGAFRLTESQITDLQSYLTSVSDDTAPSLGGELNLNNNDIVIDCRNSTGSQILAGTPVYVSGHYSTNGKALIAPARSDDPTKMPAIGVLNSTINDGNEGTVGVMGVVSQINTNSFEVGETLYVGPTGGLTNVKPSGDSELVQNLGRVLRKDASQGKMILLGAGRSNDIPNSGTFTGDVEANSFVKTGGTSSQFLKADGSVDSNTYLTSESNDLTTSVTWANVPDANITQSSVVQHSGALQVTESQVVDLGAYITTETDPVFTAHTVNSITDGTGLLQNDGAGNWSYDNSTYLTSVTNIDTTNFNATAIVTETEGISSNDNDTTLPTSAAVKDYVDNNAGTTYTAGDGLTLSGTEFSADLLSDTSAVANSVQITNIVAISQANYNALGSYDANTLYYIT